MPEEDADKLIAAVESGNLSPKFGINEARIKEYLRFSDLLPANKEKINNLLQKVRDLIADNQIKEALQTLTNTLKKDNPLYLQFASADQNYQSLETQIQLGQIERDDAKPDFERITNELKKLLRKIRFEDLR